jgi:hypothetical protein
MDHQRFGGPCGLPCFLSARTGAMWAVKTTDDVGRPDQAGSAGGVGPFGALCTMVS